MRPFSPRKKRALRLLMDSLESVCPVSSLTVAMPPRMTEVARDESAIPDAGRASHDNQTAEATIRALKLTPLVGGTALDRVAGAGSKSLVSPQFTTTASVMPGQVARVDISRYQDPITIESASRPSAAQPSGPAGGGGGGGGGGVPIPTAGKGQPTLAQPTQPVPGSGASQAVNALASPGTVVPAAASGRGDAEIRPMALKPSASPHTSDTAQPNDQIQSGSTSSGNGSASTSNYPPQGDHSFSFQITRNPNPIIGCPFSMLVTSQGTAATTFKEVDWSVDGAIQNEPYSNQAGSYTELGDVRHSIADDFSDRLGGFWGPKPGNHTVKIGVTFSDGVYMSAAPNVTVIAPTVNSFTVLSMPFVWADDQNNRIGFTVKNPIVYQANVSVPDGNPQNDYSGEIDMIQKVSRQDSETNKLSGVHTLGPNGLVLDTRITDTDPQGANYLYSDPGVSSKISNGGTGSFVLYDAPDTKWVEQIDAAGNVDTIVSRKASITLEPHLVFRPTGGIWVGLRTADQIVMTGEEGWDDTAKKWIVIAAPTPTNSTTVPVHEDYSIVTWTDWYGNPPNHSWNPPY